MGSEMCIRDRVYTIAGPEFGQYEGCVVINVRALYGLKSAGASWHAHLSDTLYSLDFKPSYADSDVWMRAFTMLHNKPYYEYVAVYVDDLLILSHDHEGLMKALSHKYTVNPTSGRYLGMRVGTYTIAKGTEEEREAWFLSADEYLKHAIEIVEGRYKLNRKWILS